MYSVSMTARLGLAMVVGTIAIAILAGSKDQSANSKDQASIPQCKAEDCAGSTNIDQITPQKGSKNTQQSIHSARGQVIVTKRDKSAQAAAVRESVDKLVNRKPMRWLAKKPPQRLVENPAQRLVQTPAQPVERPQSRRLRRADDPFVDSFN